MQEYRRRYGGTPSVIASSMAGRAVVRAADLVCLGTTSLYGVRPSQYDRINVEWGGSPRRRGDTEEVTEKRGGIRYEYLGRTAGLGTFQFGEQTVAELAVLLAQSKGGQRVNSVFGEGVNPRLRKLRDGFGELGLPADELLNHGAPRLVYGVELAENMREYLLGLARRPRYIVPQKDAAGARERIVKWWWERWARKRLERSETLGRIAGHTLVRPVRHGARVRLPRGEAEQGVLAFE